MRITVANIYPNLVKEFNTQFELSELIHCSERTVQRTLSGKREFDEWEMKTIEEYTGKSRDYLFRRRAR